MVSRAITSTVRRIQGGGFGVDLVIDFSDLPNFQQEGQRASDRPQQGQFQDKSFTRTVAGKSDVINRISYVDDRTRPILYITFKNNDQTWAYTNVPFRVANDLANASSPGRYFWRNLRLQFNDTKSSSSRAESGQRRNRARRQRNRGR